MPPPVIVKFASSFSFPGYPPFSEFWEKTAKDAYDFNASALQAVRHAAACKVARWPVIHEGKDVRLEYLGAMRNVIEKVMQEQAGN